MKTDFLFGVLVHSDIVAEIVNNIAQELDYVCRTVITTYETALDDAAELLRQGCEVLICHGGSREAVFQRHGQYTVFIERSDIDLLKALRQARAVTDEVALTAYADEPRDLTLLEEVTGMRIHEVRYREHHALERALRELLERGVRVAVGGGGTARIMERLNGVTFLDKPCPANVRTALTRAATLTAARRMEHHYLDSLKGIMTAVREGVIGVSEDGEILFANEPALRLLNCAANDTLLLCLPHLFVPEVLVSAQPRIENLVNIAERKLLVSTLPLIIQDHCRGVVVFINDVESIQGISSKIRKELYERGFTVKYNIEDLRGTSAGILRLKHKTRLYAETDLPVHIWGETGTGKELVAQSIHAASHRRTEPFVPVNCSALPESLLESELFGYEQGAFTGARKGGKPGLFELAHKGTLFLDEVGGISTAMQLRLLRVLEARELMRVGGDRIIPVDVRILSASHVSLRELIAQGVFRADLYYRLVGLSVFVPPLRDRGDDIPLLCEVALARRSRGVEALTPAIYMALRQYAWPGNVRELFAVIDNYAVLLGQKEHDDELFREVFSDRGLDAPLPPALSGAPVSSQTGKEHLTTLRLQMLRETLARCSGNKKQAARELGLSYSTVRRLLL